MPLKSILLLPAAWLCCREAARAQIPPGFELVQITFDDQYYDRYATINDCGQVVFTKKLGSSWENAEIFLYDNGRSAQLTYNNDRDLLPHINNHGTLIWCRGDGGPCRQIWQWSRDGEILLVEDPLSASPEAINDVDQFLWKRFTNSGCANSDCDILLYDYGTNVLLTPGGASYQGARMTDDLHIVYTRYDFCQNPWHGTIVYLHDSVSEDISGDQPFAQVPDINVTHHIVWDGADYAGDHVYQWENGESRLLIEDAAVPRINSRGAVCFWRYFDDLAETHAMLYTDGIIYQLTSNSAANYPDAINDAGEIVVRLKTGTDKGDLLLLRRVREGDGTLDSRIDLADHALFAACMTGSLKSGGAQLAPDVTLCDCRLVDLDRDNDIDMRDFAAFQANYGQ